jgi:hypothetical protein
MVPPAQGRCGFTKASSFAFERHRVFFSGPFLTGIKKFMGLPCLELRLAKYERFPV